MRSFHTTKEPTIFHHCASLAPLCRFTAIVLLLGYGQATAAGPSTSQGDLLAIGDSIRIGWAKYLKCEQPAENCWDTRTGLRSIDRWTQGRHWRTVVFNFGIHDINQGVPLDEYGRNLTQIVRHIHADHIYFCLTTPGREKESEGPTQAEIQAYNCVARWVMEREQVSIIDLYTLADKHREWWRRDVHYTPQGYMGFARHIKQAIGHGAAPGQGA